MKEKYEYWFASIQFLSHVKKKRLIEMVDHPYELYQRDLRKGNLNLMITDQDRILIEESKREWDLDGAYEKSQKMGVKLVTYFHPNYPKRLLPFKDAPYALFYKGNLPNENCKTAAIVGARRCSTYGEHYAMEYAELLAQCGVQVISGMAQGIDGIAQRVAMEAGGQSFGVLGSGVDVCYPREHIGLYQDLCLHGGVISEQPLGAPPLPLHFPLRNRIISALSDVILVIEAKERSGSLITADQALEQGKEVYALPGMVNSALSKGCNSLIKQGAGLLNNPEEFMEELGINICKKQIICDENKIMLESKEELVYSCIGLETKHIDWIYQETKIPIHELVNILVSLELKGYIREKSKNYYVRI